MKALPLKPHGEHEWPTQDEHLWGPYQAYSRVKKYRVCVHPKCTAVDYWDVPKGV